jgi:hypothetical protein
VKTDTLALTRTRVWLRFGLFGLVFFGIVAALLSLNSAPAEAAPEITLKPKDKLFVYADGCSLHVLKQPANQQLVQLGCEAFTPTLTHTPTATATPTETATATPTATATLDESARRLNPSGQSAVAAVEIHSGAFKSVADRTFAPSKKYEHTIRGGKKLNVRVNGLCRLKITKNTAEQINIKCKPLPPTATPTRTRTPTRTATARPNGPDGRWSGSTSQGRPISLRVTGNASSWNSFKFEFLTAQCRIYGTVPGPGPITNGNFQVAFSLNGNGFSGDMVYNGSMTSNTQMSGTWSAVNAGHAQCGTITEGGSWSARWVAANRTADSSDQTSGGTITIHIEPR